jgi:hypothetical protein
MVRQGHPERARYSGALAWRGTEVLLKDLSRERQHGSVPGPKEGCMMTWEFAVGDRVRIHITHEESALEGAEGIVTRRYSYTTGDKGYDVQMDGDAISHPFDPSELVKANA